MAKSGLLFVSFCIIIQIFSGIADKLFLSIDCGGPTGTRTDELGIKWVGDGDYIKTGKTNRVQVTTSYHEEDKTLRYFPSQIKSCYVIPSVAMGKKHMIRASFFYGNYDGKSSPPSFDLQFDGNNWASVTTSLDTTLYWEVIYAPKRDNISVCVARTSPDHIPFISALEVKEFELGMYQTEDTEDVLLKWRRTAFGAKDIIRYQSDPYDRYWHPSGAIDGVISVARDNMSSIPKFSEMSGLALAHAITPASNNETTLIVPSSEMGLVDGLYYYIFYFLEVSQVTYQTKSRSFDFFVDGIKGITLPIVPPYQSGSMVFNHGLNLSGESVISLVNTPDASLPPILNAMELFQVISRRLVSGTNEDDVKALKVLQGQYQQLQSWAGDPCLPAGFTWDWLNCNTDDPPRVIELHLNSSGLEGALPDFSGLTALEIIDLSNNSLSGQIPEFLGLLPYLEELNLAYNDFTGPLPASLKGNGKIKTNTTGNMIDDNPIPPPGPKPIIIGVSVGSVIMFLLLVGCVIYAYFGKQCRWPASNVVINNNLENPVKQQAGCIQLGPNHAFTYNEIVKITHNFEILIGDGGSGSVYYGILNNGNEVAVKVLKDLHQRGPKEFVAEVNLLMTVHHKNLVSFVGFCDEGMNLIVLYEYMQNGSLRDLLSGNKAIIEPLTWKKRLQIALDVATGLEYLHSGCQPAIIHRDIKSTNILLNGRLEAKIADFGISKAYEKTQTSSMIVGTIGYIDPQYFETSILTKKSDVYSFGVVLLELMCGRSPDQHFHVVQWATSKIVRGEIESIIDLTIKGQHKMNSMRKIAEIVLSCTAPKSTERPTMYNILKDLNEALEMEMETEIYYKA
ncbi:putative leucine-rich repeat receptor-like serine/threonine-protein kinase At2g04300 [Nymphaea colorata]|nr:putative leucine-rich repeat receptor-like serine/threonine-protein kinase At2g04300 [Nymphaea colorata]